MNIPLKKKKEECCQETVVLANQEAEEGELFGTRSTRPA
jgi:hypothetical protein